MGASVGVLSDAIIDMLAPWTGVASEERKFAANERCGGWATAAVGMAEDEMLADVIVAAGDDEASVVGVGMEVWTTEGVRGRGGGRGRGWQRNRWG